MSAPAIPRGRRWRVLVAALATLAVGIAGELAELSVLLHGLSLIFVVAALVVLSRIIPGLAAGDPGPGV